MSARVGGAARVGGPGRAGGAARVGGAARAALGGVLVAALAFGAACGVGDDEVRPGVGGPDQGAAAESADIVGAGIPEVEAVMPLPAGAVVSTDIPDNLPREDEENCDPLPSLRPDDAPPEERVPRILQRGRLIVGLDQGSNLFSFRDPASGQLTGFDVDLAREIAADIFGDPRQVEFRSLTSANRLEALENDQVDVVIRSMSITCARRERVTFSVPYYQAYQRVLTVRGSGITEIEHLEGKRVCMAAGTTSASRLWAELERITVLSVNTWADCLVAIQQNQVDAITTDDAILVGITAQDPYLQIVGPQLDAEPYGVGIAKSTPENNTDGLVRQVNSTLERIRADGTWNRMYSTWLSGLGPNPGMPEPRYIEEPR
ncbi:glutamate ABC transporter substrate-binding protein [Dietzia cinnamea]|uniref:glutamate ABC transporter substrate-binding protein n=1 Tax=Dietzia cinnamea TaxID=321318 RepID=UPI00223BB9BA|nr:glutamate ABC transporter substrate-binding protein [Dietzia cinnamea]MCT2062484.1 glutamate ABC transporter substrate-binding protein [Dietzia cinnamea]MCT2174640.1 glutamate ABC transporter substrate-binding protein [Dietzia cinnamea]MCT2235488.1 glutamate ABC transporter substrate-binding protein [Dietzia cinnamea]MCT2299461.1 glutamate ABC transporter substrate-binding protein [Dietzia cinnamea]